MPQIVLECSRNIGEFDHKEFFSGIHTILTKITVLEACKSRVVQHAQYHVGDGHEDNAFAYLRIAVLPGRDKETREEIGKACFSYLQDFFTPMIEDKQLVCKPTVEIAELAIYFK